MGMLAQAKPQGQIRRRSLSLNSTFYPPKGFQQALDRLIQVLGMIVTVIVIFPELLHWFYHQPHVACVGWGEWVNKGFTDAFTGGDKESKALTRLLLGQCFALSVNCPTLLHALDKSFIFIFIFTSIASSVYCQTLLIHALDKAFTCYYCQRLYKYFSEVAMNMLSLSWERSAYVGLLNENLKWPNRSPCIILHLSSQSFAKT